MPGQAAGVPAPGVPGQPGSLPAGWTAGGLPVGLQIIAGRLNDRLLIAAAAALERAPPWRERHPPVSVWTAVERPVPMVESLPTPV